MDLPNIPELASELARFLGPSLPYLVETGKKAGEKVAGEAALAGAKEVWKKLRGKVEEKPEATEAVRDLAEDPEDADLQAAVRVQLKKILAADLGLAGELAAFFQTVKIEGSGNAVAQVRGDRNVVVQGSGNTVGGAGSYVAARDIHLHAGSSKDSDENSLRQTYLSWVMEQTGYLALSGVDPAIKDSDRGSRLNLDAVYTGLWTRSPTRPSALDELNRHHRLVLLGAPGSGKSTFVNVLALCMAGARLGSSTANLDLLTSPIPVRDGKLKSQSWSYGPLLPIRVILRDFAAKGLPPPGEKATARHLWEFIEEDLREWGLAEYFQLLKQDLWARGGLILLDGLDEVPEAETRREQIRQVVESFVKSLGKDCRVLLTSRTYAYRSQGWSLQGFADAELAPFEAAQIERFVSRWYPHMAALGRVKAEEAVGRAERLKQAIFNSERLQGLAERPLLLTLMASLHAWRGGSLPERREELYADAVELLLDSWERQRLRVNAKGEYELLQPSLAEWLKVDQQKVRQILDELAFEIHNAQADSEGTADLPEEKLVGRLLHVSRNPDANPKQLVEYLSQRSGLLEARGVGVYSFPHRTFQEYLAACHLTGESFPKEVAALGRSGLGRWREVVLLAGAKAARGSTASVWQLVEALCWKEVDDPESGLADAWGAHLAGQVAVESANLTEIAEWNRPKLERLRRWLVNLLQDEMLPAVERVLAGESLARLGDPRPEVMTVDGMELREVPAGKFLMGDERHEVEIPYSFRMARFPVTVAQFREAVEAGGVELKNPRGLGQPSNQPMTVVSWHEARSFCAWLTGKWREQGRIGRDWEVRLPTEAEWEKAARGTEGREYPWGNEFEVDRANTSETGIGRPSTVGCFPGGESPFHCEEMSGNVLEWTLSSGEDYPYRLRDRSEIIEESSDRRRVVRGGTFFYVSRNARCAVRLGLDPDDRLGYVGFRVVAAPFSSGL
ncbi:MAG TPA: SUMF1/EgtB/PvdO family nonheme iron enzyme [Thermoanaerobaculia bacterium]|nr:SUMF1/EgtB/PvdO family nonheme iron enzyme [Thermoanaerobaculia bacterium]